MRRFAGYDLNTSSATDDETYYADSIHGEPASVLLWAPSVPAYSWLPSRYFFSMFTAKGYMW
jgi:hypothetical protein